MTPSTPIGSAKRRCGSPAKRPGSNSAALDQLRQTLVSPETTALLGALDLASKSQGLPQESREAARDLSRLLGELRPSMVGGSLPQPQLASLDQVKPETFQALRDNGVEIEPRMAKAKELAAGNPKHEAALLGLVQQDPSMTTETLEKMWQARALPRRPSGRSLPCTRWPTRSVP